MSQPTMTEFRRLSDLVTALDKRVDMAQKEAELAAAAAARAELENAKLRDEVQTLRVDNAVLRQQVQDHLMRAESWSGRLWALVTVLIGAVLTLVSGLIVTLAKK